MKKTIKLIKNSLATLCLILLIAPIISGQSDKPFKIDTYFIPSGFMGDHSLVELYTEWKITPQSPPLCIKISYKESGNQKWAGIYWQNKPNN